jgi:hypothetical protein
MMTFVDMPELVEMWLFSFVAARLFLCNPETHLPGLGKFHAGVSGMPAFPVQGGRKRPP